MMEPNVVNKKLVIVAAALLLDIDKRFLLTQRPPGKSLAGYWEFPGGKLEVGETPELALVRELKEELDLQVKAQDLTEFSFISHTYPDFHLLMPVFLCFSWQGQASSQEGQRLSWVKFEEVADYPLLPADLPLLPFIKKWLLSE